jgi:hypothetical protein
VFANHRQGLEGDGIAASAMLMAATKAAQQLPSCFRNTIACLGRYAGLL